MPSVVAVQIKVDTVFVERGNLLLDTTTCGNLEAAVPSMERDARKPTGEREVSVQRIEFFG